MHFIKPILKQPQSTAIIHKRPHGMTLLVTALTCLPLLTACGSGDDRKNASVEHEHDHDHGHEVSPDVVKEINRGRLLIADSGSTQAHVYSIAQGKIIQKIDLSSHTDALQTSPKGTFALVLSRQDNQVKFVHSGLVIEDHGDHDHPYARDASMMPLTLSYATPNHYQVHGEQAGLFFDGKGKAGNPIENLRGQTGYENAGFALVTDTAITEGELPHQRLNTNMHGTAEAQGNYVISTLRQDTVGSPLADTLVVYEQHNDHYHQHQIMDVKCPALHGSSSKDDDSVFACSDGVVKVHKDGDRFTASKIAHPASLASMMCQRPGRDPLPARFGSFISHASNPYIIGTACGQPYQVDAKNEQIHPIAWTTDADRKVLSYAFDDMGKLLLLLDDKGDLHLIDTSNNNQLKASFNVIATGVADGGHGGPKLVVNPNLSEVYVLDSHHKQIVVIDPELAKVDRRIAVDFTPSQLAWFGVKQPRQAGS